MRYAGAAVGATEDEGRNARQEWQYLWAGGKPVIYKNGDQDYEGRAWKHEDEDGSATEWLRWASTGVWKAKQQAKECIRLGIRLEEDQELLPSKIRWEWNWRWTTKTQPSP